MKSVGDLNSSARPIPHTSLPSGTPSSAQNLGQNASNDTQKIEVRVETPPRERDLAEFVPSLSSAIVAVAVAVMVHRLTRRREKDKSVFELHRTIIDTVKEVRTAANNGWTARSRAKRSAAIIETSWQLQRTGSQVNLLWRQSRSRSFLIWEHSIYLNDAMAALRDAITLDDFMDQTRAPRPSEQTNVERAVGTFLDCLDAELIGWVDRSNRRVSPKILAIFQERFQGKLFN